MPIFELPGCSVVLSFDIDPIFTISKQLFKVVSVVFSVFQPNHEFSMVLLEFAIVPAQVYIEAGGSDQDDAKDTCQGFPDIHRILLDWAVIVCP